MALCLPILCQAKLQIKGQIKTENGLALLYADVLVLSSSDSSLVRGQVSGDDGFFFIDLIEEGQVSRARRRSKLVAIIMG